MMGYDSHTYDIRPYELGGSKGFQCMTVCDFRGKKVGSADCQRNCQKYAGRDDSEKKIFCWK